MLIKAKSTKKGRVAFLSRDATDQEIQEFIGFLQAGPRKPAEAKRADKAPDPKNAGKKTKTGKMAARKRPVR
jgi:hypothetical protein